MLSNKLKLNKDKPEVLVISSSYRPQPPLSSVDICNETVSCSPSARNIVVIFDQSLCMVPHVNAVCQSSFFHLRNIRFIRKYLTSDTAKIIIHAFVVSKLDYCNSLLYGLCYAKASTCSKFCRSPCQPVSKILPYYSSPEGSSLAPCLLSY